MEDLRACMISAFSMMRDHRWVSRICNRPLGLEKNCYYEGLRIMSVADVTEELSYRGGHALATHLVGFSLQVLEMPFSNQ